MGVDERNIQVMDGCRRDTGKLPIIIIYSYGTYSQVAIILWCKNQENYITIIILVYLAFHL